MPHFRAEAEISPIAIKSLNPLHLHAFLCLSITFPALSNTPPTPRQIPQSTLEVPPKYPRTILDRTSIKEFFGLLSNSRYINNLRASRVSPDLLTTW